MGSISKYEGKDLCWVYSVADVIDEGSQSLSQQGVKYLFWTNIPTAVRNDLGIATITGGLLPTACALSPSYPRPAKASKKVISSGQTASRSSFVAPARIKPARLDGWRVTKNRKAPPVFLADAVKALVRTVYVTIRDIKYAWNMPKETLTRLQTGGMLAKLGIKLATEADIKTLVFGANFPKPGRAIVAIKDVTGDNGSLIQTFYDPSNDEDGFNIIEPPVLSLLL